MILLLFRGIPGIPIMLRLVKNTRYIYMFSYVCYIMYLKYTLVYTIIIKKDTEILSNIIKLISLNYRLVLKLFSLMIRYILCNIVLLVN